MPEHLQGSVPGQLYSGNNSSSLMVYSRGLTREEQRWFLSSLFPGAAVTMASDFALFPVLSLFLPFRPFKSRVRTTFVEKQREGKPKSSSSSTTKTLALVTTALRFKKDSKPFYKQAFRFFFFSLLKKNYTT